MELDSLFKPSSIAVVGASRNRDKVGNIILRNLISTYASKIYPVNKSTESVEGLRSFQSLSALPDSPDLAVVAVPRRVVPEVIEEAARLGVRSAIVISSGFRERDPEGAKLEEQMIRTARSGKLRILGPNTLGLLTPRFNATFTFSDVKAGPLAVVTQSGGIGVYMLNWAHSTRTGMSYFVSLGNQADITESEVYGYLADDPDTRAILSYNEGVTSGKLFLETLPSVTAKKPVVFLKGGVGNKGAAAVRTHTGSLAGSTEVFRAAVNTVGGVYVENLEEFLDLAKIVLSREPIRRRLMIVTNSGGHGVLATDEVEREGMELIDLPPGFKERLEAALPAQCTPGNPLDLSGDADSDRYDDALRLIQDIDCSKVVMVQSLPMISCTELARVLLNYRSKGVVGVLMGTDEEPAIRMLDAAGLPAYKFPEDAVRSVRYLTGAKHRRLKTPVAQPIREAAELVSRGHIDDKKALELVGLYGFKTPKFALVRTAAEAERAAEDAGYPVVMKIAPKEPTHKTELGGVSMNVEREDVKTVFSRLSKITPEVMVQEQLLGGAEVFLGGVDDPTFGKVVAVGLGGVYVEVLKSVSYGLCPVPEDEAEEMLLQSRVHQLLNSRKRGYNEPEVTRDVTRLSRMLVDLDLKQVDINPLIVNEKGCYAVDVRMVG